jgi:hypothetical protein
MTICNGGIGRDRVIMSLAVATVIGVCFSSGGASLAGQRTQRFVDGKGGRPLADAIRTLETRYGWPITYEDPRYEHLSQIKDVTQEVRRKSGSAKPVLVPRGIPFTFVYEDLEPNDSPVVIRALLQRLLDTYSTSGNPGSFEVIESEGIFHVLPVSALSRSGNLVDQSSILDTRITLPTKERTVYETLDEVLRIVTGTTGTHVWIGAVPLNLVATTKYQDGSNNEPARNVISRALSQTRRTLSWRLLYAPDGREYAFNVHVVATSSRQ